MATPDFTPPPIPADEILSGERLLAIADRVVVTDDQINFHHSLPADKLVRFSPDLEPDANALNSLKGARVIFVFSDLIEPFLARVLPMLDRPVVVISHNGDTGFYERFRPSLDDPKIVHWFAQNATFSHPKLTALPIGIANSQWKHGDAAALARVAGQGIPKRSGLYVNFEIGTNRKVRGPILEALAQKPFAIMGRRRRLLTYFRQAWAALNGRTFVDRGKPKPYPTYLTEMAGWRFCVSPPGNGLDCHRTWEALYLGVTPVLTPVPGGLLNGLPCLIVDDLSAVTMEGLEAGLSRLGGSFAWERLTLSYWKEQIRRHADNAPP